MPCNLLSLPLILLYVGGYAQLSHLILPLHDDLEVQNLCVCRRRAAFYQVSIWLPGKQRQLRLGSGDMSSALSLPLPSCVSVARPSASLRLPFLFWKKGEHQPPLEVTETSPRSHKREAHRCTSPTNTHRCQPAFQHLTPTDKRSERTRYFRKIPT